jgi:hypothetical protein
MPASYDAHDNISALSSREAGGSGESPARAAGIGELLSAQPCTATPSLELTVAHRRPRPCSAALAPSLHTPPLATRRRAVSRAPAPMPSVAAGREVDEAGYDDLRVGQTSRHSGRRKSRLRLSRRECAVLAGLVLLICGFGLRAVTQRLGWMNPTHFYSDQPLEILELGAIKWFHCPDVHVDGAECGVAVCVHNVLTSALADVQQRSAGL